MGQLYQKHLEIHYGYVDYVCEHYLTFRQNNLNIYRGKRQRDKISLKKIGLIVPDKKTDILYVCIDAASSCAIYSYYV